MYESQERWVSLLDEENVFTEKVINTYDSNLEHFLKLNNSLTNDLVRFLT